jgi:hypothetical protein
MAQIFRPSANALSTMSIVAALLSVGVLAFVAAAIYRSDYVTRIGLAQTQPIPFSHRHHVDGIGVDCRYCHTLVETASYPGIPPTETCMSCHSQIWADSPTLEPVRASYRTDESIRWNKVHDLADYVYFNHSIHVTKGIGCSTCHGRIDQMPLVARQKSLRMEWCLGCHREPERYVRPREQIFNMEWEPPADQESMGEELVSKYKIQKLTDCYTCHR